MKLLKGLALQLIPQEDGVSLSRLEVNAHIGTTDDPNLNKVRRQVFLFAPIQQQIKPEFLFSLQPEEQEFLNKFWLSVKARIEKEEQISLEEKLEEASSDQK